MTPNEQVVQSLRALADLIESYASLGPQDVITPGIKGSHVHGGGEQIAAALLLAGATTGDWYGPHVRQQREVCRSFQGVDFRAYQVLTREPLCATCAASDPAAPAKTGGAS